MKKQIAKPKLKLTEEERIKNVIEYLKWWNEFRKPTDIGSRIKITN